MTRRRDFGHREIADHLSVKPLGNPQTGSRSVGCGGRFGNLPAARLEQGKHEGEDAERHDQTSCRWLQVVALPSQGLQRSPVLEARYPQREQRNGDHEQADGSRA